MTRGPVLIRWSAVFLYLFILLLVQLGRIHIGLMFDFFFFLLLLIPTVSLLHLFLSILALKYHQNFGTDHPVKGEHLTYSLLLSNESHFGTPRIHIAFATAQPGSPTRIPDLDLSLKRGERRERSYTISCPYRGIYTVGLDRLELYDLLGFLRVSRPVWRKTFYVYPRVLPASYPFAVGDMSDLSTGPNPGASQDYSLFESLVPYRSGESVRHIAWKKFFALGEPFLKSYARTSRPGLSIYFDLRREESPSPSVLEREDSSVEILVSLVKYFTDRKVPVSIDAAGHSRYHFNAASEHAFAVFHKDTINLMFTRTISPAEVYRSDTLQLLPRSSVLFITHKLDPSIIEIMEDSMESVATGSPEVACIINQATMPPETSRACSTIFEGLRERGALALLVQGADSLSSDLRRVP